MKGRPEGLPYWASGTALLDGTSCAGAVGAGAGATLRASDVSIVVGARCTLAIPASVIDQVRRVEGVAKVAGSVFVPGLIARKSDGSKLKGRGFNALTSVSVEPFGAASYSDGRAPETDGEVAIIKSTADAEDLSVGDSLVLSAEAPKKRYRVLGTAGKGGKTMNHLPLNSAKSLFCAYAGGGPPRSRRPLSQLSARSAKWLNGVCSTRVWRAAKAKYTAVHSP